jgi:cardiolipin synthase
VSGFHRLILIPNLITLGRIVSVPVLVFLLLNGSFVAAFWVFILAGASDAVDGAIAKRYGLTSDLGSFLDPLADKALLMATYVCLGALAMISPWLVILIVFRDLLILGGALLYHLLIGTLTMAPLMVSKANTVIQIVFVILVLAGAAYGNRLSTDLSHLLPFCEYIVAAITLTSGAAYVWIWGKKALEAEDSVPKADKPRDSRPDGEKG